MVFPAPMSISNSEFRSASVRCVMTPVKRLRKSVEVWLAGSRRTKDDFTSAMTLRPGRRFQILGRLISNDRENLVFARDLKRHFDVHRPFLDGCHFCTKDVSRGDTKSETPERKIILEPLFCDHRGDAGQALLQLVKGFYQLQPFRRHFGAAAALAAGLGDEGGAWQQIVDRGHGVPGGLVAEADRLGRSRDALVLGDGLENLNSVAANKKFPVASKRKEGVDLSWFRHWRASKTRDASLLSNSGKSQKTRPPAAGVGRDHRPRPWPVSPSRACRSAC